MTCWRPFSNQSNWLISQLLSEDNGPCKKATCPYNENPQYSPTAHCSEGAKECPSAHHTSTYYSGHYCIIIIDWLVPSSSVCLLIVVCRPNCGWSFPAGLHRPCMPLLNTVGTQYGTTISPANDKGPRNNNRLPFLNKK